MCCGGEVSLKAALLLLRPGLSLACTLRLRHHLFFITLLLAIYSPTNRSVLLQAIDGFCIEHFTFQIPFGASSASHVSLSPKPRNAASSPATGAHASASLKFFAGDHLSTAGASRVLSRTSCTERGRTYDSLLNELDLLKA